MDTQSEPIIEIDSIDLAHPGVLIKCNGVQMFLSGSQARVLFGKLGKALDKITPDDFRFK